MSESQTDPALEEYRSVAGRADVEVVRRRSRFLGIVDSVESAADAEAVIESARLAHPQASHVCFAYRAGRSAPAIRMSDAGEPSGTAGRPILDVIERNSLENTCVVVVRYFGGVLLGAGGLTRAYAAAAAEGIAAAGIATYAPHSLLRLDIGYSDWSKVERILQSLGARVVNVRYEAQVIGDIAVPTARRETLEASLNDATAGAARIQDVGHMYMPKVSN